jgi:hypothetical protein
MTLSDQITNQQNPLNTSAALEKLGLGSSPSTEQLLKNNRLDEATTFERLAALIDFAQSDAIKLQALKMAMDASNQAKAKTESGVNSVTIIIQDPEMAGKINPILYPRKKGPVVDITAEG